MHDLDRTQLESGYETYQSEQFEFAFEGDSEVYGEIGLEGPLSEAEEMELAAELLSISSEEELDQFLGKLFKGAVRGIKKVGSAVGKVARGPLGGILKGIAKKALPFVGSALGSFIPIPGVGTAVGGALGSALSKALETEFEGLNAEDREFEMARRYVRLAATSARNVANAPPNVPPQVAAKQAVLAAAKQQIPNLAINGSGQSIPDSTGVAAAGTGRSGRWIRRGRKIILLGA